MHTGYSSAISYIEDALKFGINPGLERIEAICDGLGRPQDAFPAIQITGTNGKTSTAWMAGTVLSAVGLKVGVYTSPHLHSYCERVAIGAAVVSEGKRSGRERTEGEGTAERVATEKRRATGKRRALGIRPISEEQFAASFLEIRPVLETVRRDFGELTEFEILTALALQSFARDQVDVAVLEVGLGGRWDATSVVRPRVAVLTNVDLEHTDRLGTTFREIAWEKAHVIKSACTAVVGELQPEALLVIEERVAEQGADLRLMGRDFKLAGWEEGDVGAAGEDSTGFALEGLFARYGDLAVSVLGGFQVTNACLAVAASEALLGSALDVRAVRAGLRAATSPGRLEVVREQPLVVLDGAHNPAGMARLMQAFERLRDAGARPQSPRLNPEGRPVVVAAFSADKDIGGMLEELARAGLGRDSGRDGAGAGGDHGRRAGDRGSRRSILILSENRSYRSAKAVDVAAVARRLGLDLLVEPDLEAAVRHGLDLAGPGGALLVTGSLYTVAEARALLLGLR